jgi:hypothetical protein
VILVGRSDSTVQKAIEEPAQKVLRRCTNWCPRDFTIRGARSGDNRHSGTESNGKDLPNVEDESVKVPSSRERAVQRIRATSSARKAQRQKGTRRDTGTRSLIDQEPERGV